MQKIHWNKDWYFNADYNETLLSPFLQLEDLEPISLPHSVVETPFHYFSEDIYQKISGYVKKFHAPLSWQNKALLLTFEGVAHKADVMVNGVKACTHLGGYTAFTVDISPLLKWDAENFLVVKVDSRETLNMPPFGYVIDYMTYGGIYREVFLEVKEKAYLKDVFAYGKEVLSEQPKMVVSHEVVTSETHKLQGISYTLKDAEGQIVFERQVEIEEGFLKEFSLPKMKLWDLDTPYLYTLHVALIGCEDSSKPSVLLDEKVISMGFRDARFDASGFMLNGKRLKLRGLNRHQSYPYVGYAMPSRPQRLDAKIMKEELGLNAVRTSHYPQSKHFIEACDQLGLLVFTEIPGWQHIGDEVWKAQVLTQVEEMVTQYRNHPSIILWGVRINESMDDDVLYEKTNQLARALDPSRQTGGVRCIKNSRLFEDVYTYNDFSYNGKTRGIESKSAVTKTKEQAYLISEYNGHMFPTKAFDSEAHRTEHAIRHAVVLNAIAGDAHVAGGFGWCLFDYNTHQDFGSGDRICYHGVLDMFRNPKLAAAVYQSQGERHPVLKISSDMAIGDYPEGAIGTVYAFSNADEIKLYKNGAFVKSFFPDEKQFGHLPHPPFVIDDFIGELMEKNEKFSYKKSQAIKSVLMAVSRYGQSRLPLKYKLKALYCMLFYNLTPASGQKLFYDYVGNWGGKATVYRFDAIKKGQVVESLTKKPTQRVDLDILVDTQTLKEEGTYDVATVRIRAVNEFGEVLSYFNEPLTLTTQGAIEIIGPKVLTLKGGMGGTYVKTKGQVGSGQLSMVCQSIEKTIIFHVKG